MDNHCSLYYRLYIYSSISNLYICIYMSIYIYIYIERERERYYKELAYALMMTEKSQDPL